jgi:hypothetical protein
MVEKLKQETWNLQALDVVKDMSISDSGMIDANECNCMRMQ